LEYAPAGRVRCPFSSHSFSLSDRTLVVYLGLIATYQELITLVFLEYFLI
jgi:hypothetical protein